MPTQTRARTVDRGSASANRAPLYTVGVIGPKRKMRHDGSLLCEDVPIARTGIHLYQPGEVPIRPPTRDGAAQVLYVTRDRMTLFAPESLGSVVGAAVTNSHPPTDVTPENWAMLAKGFVLDAWQGEEDEADLMFADLVVSDRGLIHKINSGEIREVSLGYTADYEQTGDGEGRQRNIIINHLALVERGRCGPRCSIGDRQPEEETMPRLTTGTGGSRPRVRLQEATQALQEALALQDQGDEEDDDSVHVHVHMNDGAPPRKIRTTDKAGPGDDDDPDGDDDDAAARTTTHDALVERVDAIETGMLEMKNMLETALGQLAGVPPKEPAATTTTTTTTAATGDSAALATGFQQFIAQAEILVPGFKAPTFDAALPRAKTVDAMCGGRRQVLTLLGATTEGAALINSVAAEEGFSVATADCASVGMVFKAAAALKGTTNNRSATGDKLGVAQSYAAAQGVVPSGGTKVPTADEINKANAEFWDKKPQ